ncbi:MAG: response regulator [Lachnospiraceae bacterium]|nr:response regulator [Lachnospiraceae bacterium]
MKILVVEDEIKTLRGICHLIDTLPEEYQVAGMAKSGEEGLRLARELGPDVILSDIRMKGITGLEMIQRLQEEGLSCKYLILSGYADFHYAREALVLGSVDYLLKPVTAEDLEKALKKVADLLLEEASSIRIHTFSTEELLGRVLNEDGEEYEQEFWSRFALGSRKLLLLVRSEARLVQKDLQAISQILYEALPGVSCVTYVNEEHKELYLLGEILSEDLSKEQIYGQLDRAAQACYETVNAYLVCSAELFMESGSLVWVKNRIRDNSNWNLTLKKPLVIHRERVEALSCAKFSYPSWLERDIINAINKGELDKAGEELEGFLSYLNASDYAYTDVREALICLTAAILYAIRMASYGLYENISHLNLMEWVQGTLFTEHYRQMIRNLLHQYARYEENVKQSKHPIINKVLKIIEAEYAGDISQEHIARRMNITPEYLSALFIKELGVKYAAYCTQCRIQAAKRMLEEEGRKIYEVAESCGYGDVKYFCKVFKKYTGISPSEYQHSRIYIEL